jgi:FMN-dependent NADH-azoreductase
LQGTAFIDEARANELRRSLVATIEPAMVSLVQTSLEQASSR